MRQSPVLMWFRQDLRLSDHPALTAAVKTGRPVIGLYILNDGGDRRLGGARLWWLHHSLERLAADLARHGVPLILKRGSAPEMLDQVIAQTGAKAIAWTRRYAPDAVAQDRAIKADLTERGIQVLSRPGHLLLEPWEVKTKQGGAYGVFTPFWRALQGMADRIDEPLPAPDGLEGAAVDPDLSDRPEDWGLLPTRPDWAGGLRATWTPGEAAAQNRLGRFVGAAVADYRTTRDRPDLDQTSRLSPHLAHGEISPRQIWHAVIRHHGFDRQTKTSPQVFLSELAWRDFSYGLLYRSPRLESEPLQQKFARFPWRDDPQALAAWQKGETGYPIVDAAMRCLWATGWMHNRLRMIVGSFLVKHLLQPWQAGEAWFWDTLVDADPASNAASWQWVAGCGADAAPYFRIFNPIIQGEKFDPDGAFVKQWLPALKSVPAGQIHKPWAASQPVLRHAGVSLGDTYPEPLVDHQTARDRALGAFDSITSAA